MADNQFTDIEQFSDETVCWKCQEVSSVILKSKNNY